MLESEVAHRDRARRARLLKQARFPVSKSVEGFGWSNVPFPDGWGVGRCAPYVRAWHRGPGLLWPDEQGQDPHSHHDWDCHDVHGLFGEVLTDRPAGASAGQGQAGGHAGRAAGRQGQGEVARSRRVRLSALRRGRGKATVPGDTRGSREEERDIHDQRRVQQVGHRLRGRQTRGGNPAASCTTSSGWRWAR